MRIGLLGAGRIGRIHGGNVAAHPRVNLAAVRGLLFDLALTGDRDAADAGMRLLGERFGLTATPSPVEVYPMR